MKRNLAFAGLGLAVLLGGSLVLPPKVLGQDTTDALSRKVRTKVMPEYPPVARELHITGRVKIEATIAADGHVASTKVVGGSPLLVNAALDALRRWQFEPAAKESTVTLEFEFNGFSSEH